MTSMKKTPIAGVAALASLIAALSGQAIAQTSENCTYNCIQACLAIYPMGNPQYMEARAACIDDCIRLNGCEP